MRPAWVVKVDDIELRFHLVGLQMMKQMIVGYLGQIGELVVVDIHRKAFLNLLLDIVVHDSVRLSRTRCAEYHRGAEGIDYVNPALIPFFLIVKTCGEIDGILILHQSCFLHETLILCVEYIVHQVIFE